MSLVLKFRWPLAEEDPEKAKSRAVAVAAEHGVKAAFKGNRGEFDRTGAEGTVAIDGDVLTIDIKKSWWARPLASDDRITAEVRKLFEAEGATLIQ